jgi:hypothetical protein
MRAFVPQFGQLCDFGRDKRHKIHVISKTKEIAHDLGLSMAELYLPELSL